MPQPMMFPQEQHVVWTERDVSHIDTQSELSNANFVQLGFFIYICRV